MYLFNYDLNEILNGSYICLISSSELKNSILLFIVVHNYVS